MFSPKQASQAGYYTINLVLTDSLALSSSYQLHVTVLAPKINTTSNELVDPSQVNKELSAQIISVSNQGKVAILFSLPILVP
jgi:hypothetical protein